jgi:RNA polymerase sigma-70 factor (ECF subfamily)
VIFRIDTGPGGDRPVVSGAAAVAEVVLERGRGFAPFARPAIVNGNAGLVIVPHRRPVSVVAFAVAAGRVVEIDVIADSSKVQLQ